MRLVSFIYKSEFDREWKRREGRIGLREKRWIGLHFSLSFWSTKREIGDLISFSLCIILRSELSSTKTNGIVGSFSQLASQVSFFNQNTRAFSHWLALCITHGLLIFRVLVFVFFLLIVCNVNSICMVLMFEYWFTIFLYSMQIFIYHVSNVSRFVNVFTFHKLRESFCFKRDILNFLVIAFLILEKYGELLDRKFVCVSVCV